MSHWPTVELEKARARWAEEQRRAKAENRLPDPRLSDAAARVHARLYPDNHDGLIMAGIFAFGVVAAVVAAMLLS